jgi:sulfur carrier protein
VRELLSVLGVEPNRIAVELNHRLVKRQAWETTPVADRDHIEIVEFVGGG